MKANHERYHARRKAWHEANRERERARTKAWHEANRERHLATSKAWRQANHGRALNASKAWSKAHPERHVAISRTRRARKLNAIGPHCTAEEMAATAAALGGRCIYCDGPYQHDDHFWPLSAYRDDGPANMAPACSRCNSSKGDAHPADWMERRLRDGATLTPDARALLALLRAEPLPADARLDLARWGVVSGLALRREPRRIS